ncbi:hypothetical protein THASP1DRAFT_31946 [Thamnocephalis sphaerospora]|uniref:Smr domain-containing protein n=1 Tax=Thamnocephalis sphaerospora TaxID=78915 RepID=A0A4P9XKA8_9FUNG|nr:hypothetical protein THASP1DRAFT_31946 [Thamnocephalis sphaerospora]|eukprot:RKP06233.1 hypothetical protein THASP1DRAFT_31946 [Thamnocephalis sphaerospora]
MSPLKHCDKLSSGRSKASKKRPQQEKQEKQAASPQDVALNGASTAAAASRGASSSWDSEDADKEREAFLRACFPDLSHAQLQSAMGRCNGDVDRIMDWILGESHGEGEVMHRLRPWSASLDASSTASAASSQPCGSTSSSSRSAHADSHSSDLGAGSEHESFTSGSGHSWPASTASASMSAASGATGTSSGGKSRSLRGHRSKKQTGTMHLESFLAAKPATPMSPAHTDAWAAQRVLSPVASVPMDSGSWSAIERTTNQLTAVFPHTSREVIRSTLHACQLDLDAATARLADMSLTPSSAASATAGASRGLSRWRPSTAGSTAASTRNTASASPVATAAKPKSTTKTPLPAKDESLQMEQLLDQLQAILPNHDIETLTDTLLAFQFNLDAAVAHLLDTSSDNAGGAKTKSNGSGKKTKKQSKGWGKPMSITTPGSPAVGVPARKSNQVSMDFWTAQRHHRDEQAKASKPTPAATKVTKMVASNACTSKQERNSDWKSAAGSRRKTDTDGDEETYHQRKEADPIYCQQVADEYLELRNEAYRKAATAFRNRNHAGSGGAAVAAYYATEGRNLDNKVRTWNTRAALGVLHSFQATWDREYLVDLHYMNVDQAVEVALLAAQDWSAMERAKADVRAPARPLRIVTGAGRHSRNGRAKLLPNVQRALKAAGWTTEMFDSGSFLVKNPRPKVQG